MAKKNLGNKIGGIAFLVGVALALILGLSVPKISEYASLPLILVVAGIIVGLFNIADKESTPFLFSCLALVIVSRFGMDALVIGGERIVSVFKALLILFVPATVVVALRNAFMIAKR